MTRSPPRAVLRTPLGDIVIALRVDHAPLSCADFLQRIDKGGFAGASFYRIVDAATDTAAAPISIVQGGALGAESASGIPHEPTSRSGLAHRDGTISIARAAPGSGSTAAFFICVGDQPELDAGGGRQPDGLGFAAFGEVLQGMDIIRAIHGRLTDPKGPAPFLDAQMLSEPVPIISVERTDG